MNTVHEEKICITQDETREEYEYLSDEEVIEMSDALIEKHREALTALANA